jgi:hypothetical protein
VLTLTQRLPPEGTARVLTYDDLQSLQAELIAEIRRSARKLMFALTTIVAVWNGIVFAALNLT